jgi:hypothetical protein
MMPLRAGAVGSVSEEQLQFLLIEMAETVFRVTFGNDPYTHLLSRLKSNTFDFELPNDAGLMSPVVTLVVEVSQGMRLRPRAERTCLGFALEHALVNAIYRGNLGLGPSVTPSHHQIVFGRATTDLIEKRNSEAPYKDRVTTVCVVVDLSGVKVTVRDGGDAWPLIRLAGGRVVFTGRGMFVAKCCVWYLSRFWSCVPIQGAG